MKNLLKVNQGRVELYSSFGNRIRTYYTKGDAVRADFYDEKKESIVIQCSSGKLLIISKGGNIIRTI